MGRCIVDSEDIYTYVAMIQLREGRQVSQNDTYLQKGFCLRVNAHQWVLGSSKFDCGASEERLMSRPGWCKFIPKLEQYFSFDGNNGATIRVFMIDTSRPH